MNAIIRLLLDNYKKAYQETHIFDFDYNHFTDELIIKIRCGGYGISDHLYYDSLKPEKRIANTTKSIESMLEKLDAANKQHNELLRQKKNAEFEKIFNNQNIFITEVK